MPQRLSRNSTGGAERLALLAGRLFGTLVIAFLLAGIALCQSLLVSRTAQAQESKLRIFDHCVNGDATLAEAERVGQAIAKRVYRLSFDSSIFSADCAEQISRFLFSTYDENASLRLVRFFWSDPLLDRLRAVSFSAPDKLQCNFVCLLALDRRPLPTDLMFQRVLRGTSSLDRSSQTFLLARTLFVDHKMSARDIGRSLRLTTKQELRAEIVKFLYVLGSSTFIKSVFDDRGGTTCIAGICIDIGTVDRIADCNSLNAKIISEKNLDGIVALKHWALTNGEETVQRCLEGALHHWQDPVFFSRAQLIFGLCFFNPEMEFNDVVNGFVHHVFKKFDFLNSDISRLSNVDLSRIGGSWTFIRRLVAQMPRNPNSLAFLASDKGAVNRSLILGSDSGARLQLLLCRYRSAGGRFKCDRRSIYLEAMSQSIE
jgi:hypothetical protein